MDRSARHRVCADPIGQRVFQPLRDLLGGPVGERHGADAVWIDAGRDQVLDARDEAVGLAGAGPRDDQDGAHWGLNCAKLLRKRNERHGLS